MMHHFDRVMVGKDKLIIKGGVISTHYSYIAFWMGTPPPDEDFEPVQCMRMKWDAMLCSNGVNLSEGFTFEITTREGVKFEGEALIIDKVGEDGKYKYTDSCMPVIVNFKEVHDEITSKTTRKEN